MYSDDQQTPPSYGYSREQRQVSFGEAIKMGFDNYVNFSGRSSRSEYWWWFLFSFLVGWVGEGLAAVTGSWISYIITAAMILPGLTMCVRRLHDIGKGGGWIFICFIPLVGGIIMLIWMCKPSEEFANRFGEVPNLE